MTTDQLLTAEEVLERITELRSDDIKAFNNLPQRFIEGRKGNRIPSTSSDVLDTDLKGDINYEIGFFYILMDDGSGGLTWRKGTLNPV